MDKDERSNIEIEARDQGLGTLNELELDYIESEIEYSLAAKLSSISDGQVLDHQEVCERFKNDTSSDQRKKAIVVFVHNILDQIISD